MLIENFDLFCIQYTPMVKKIISKAIGKPFSAEVDDICQDVFLYFLEKLDSFPNSDGPISLLRLCAHHRALDYLRTQRTHLGNEVDLGTIVKPEDLFDLEGVEALKEAFRLLSKHDQDLLFLRFWQGYTLETCAKRLKSTKTTVERHLKNILHKLHVEHTQVPTPKFAQVL